eukprot:TRINITY_DN4837_c0_g1_i3.p1 TRINITY_DN4837_c0_g1~~TRINITY_DN4837_c0_g1_i3.p1  ORF type:complete len:162 (+),score=22.08 TRINITY_DN4837_c0_g1_i3:202-687(+)
MKFFIKLKTLFLFFNFSIIYLIYEIQFKLNYFLKYYNNNDQIIKNKINNQIQFNHFIFNLSEQAGYRRFSSSIFLQQTSAIFFILVKLSLLALSISNQGPSGSLTISLQIYFGYYVRSVSYTHLTLPTICSVQISVVAGSLKKKKINESKIRIHKYTTNQL